MLSDVARCCGKGSFTSGFEYLQRFHSSMGALLMEGDTRFNMVRCIIVDSAYEFAQRVPQTTHLDHASQMNLLYSSRTRASKYEEKQESMQVAKSGFRWEEGIGEWVSATPAINLSKICSLSLFDEQNKMETPIQPRMQKTVIVVNDHLESPQLRNRLVAVEIPKEFSAVDVTGDLDSSSTSDGERHDSGLDKYDTTDMSDVSDDETIDSKDSVRRSLRFQTKPPYQNEPTTAIEQPQQFPSSIPDTEADSDDELSFLSVSSQVSHTAKTSETVHTTSSRRVLRSRPEVKEVVGLKRRKRRFVDYVSDSEDELCL